MRLPRPLLIGLSILALLVAAGWLVRPHVLRELRLTQRLLTAHQLRGWAYEGDAEKVRELLPQDSHPWGAQMGLYDAASQGHLLLRQSGAGD